MEEFFMNSWDALWKGLAFGLILGALWSIISLLRRIWSTLLSIESELKYGRYYSERRRNDK
jgi:hypothetical protein